MVGACTSSIILLKSCDYMCLSEETYIVHQFAFLTFEGFSLLFYIGFDFEYDLCCYIKLIMVQIKLMDVSYFTSDKFVI